MSDEQNRKQHSNYQHDRCNNCCTLCFFHFAHSRPVISCNCCTHRKAQSRCGLSQNPSSVLHCLSACLSPQAAYGKSFRTFRRKGVNDPYTHSPPCSDNMPSCCRPLSDAEPCPAPPEPKITVDSTFAHPLRAEPAAYGIHAKGLVSVSA